MPIDPTPSFGVTNGRANPASVAAKLNNAFNSKTGLIVGDGIIEASHIGPSVHLRLKVENLLPLIPKGTPTATIVLADSPDSFLTGLPVGGMYYKGMIVDQDPADGVDFNCIVLDRNQFQTDNTVTNVFLGDGTSKTGIPLNAQRVLCRLSSDPTAITINSESYPLYELFDTPGVKRSRVNPTTGWVERTHMTFGDDDTSDAYWIQETETALVTCLQE